MSPEKLKALGIDEKWFQPLMDTFAKYNISTTKRQANFLGQCMHESGNFKTLQENLNYSAEALMRVWPSRFPTKEIADQYARNPEKIANKVYGGRMGNTDDGDGWKYRGRGVIQLTGKENYRNCGDGIFAAMSSGWFWNKKGLNDLSDAGDIETITKRINGGLIGLDDRKAKVAKAQQVLDTF